MSNPSKPIPITPLDQKSFSGPTQMLKAAIPYFQPIHAQKLAMLARIFEFKSTMNIFVEEQLSICSVPNGSRPNIEDILRDIRKYCAPAEADQIDQFLNMFNAMRLYNQYNDLVKNSDLSNIMNQFNNMNSKCNSNHSDFPKNMGINMTPEQIQMLQNFLHSQSTPLSTN